MIATGPLRKDALGRGCQIEKGRILVDGWVRDRCPYIGDLAVTDLSLDVAAPYWQLQRSMLRWFGDAQHADGAIPASPYDGGRLVLFDYNAYWLQTLYAYTLHSGDLALTRLTWPHVRALMRWYKQRTTKNGVVVNRDSDGDYAFIGRKGTIVAYYNAQYALALTQAVQLARWIGETADVAGWQRSAKRLEASFDRTFWDRSAGAYRDTSTDSDTHPQDGNAFAVIAGLATRQQALSALGYLSAHNQRAYGNVLSDSTVWNHRYWGDDATDRVVPFMSYHEVVARFEQGLTQSALELIRREWGYMIDHGPRATMWETISTNGRPAGKLPSWAHGWSSGAAPALTEYVLGVRSTSPGYATFTVKPHPGDLTWAKGTVPTPHGPIHVGWKVHEGRLALRVDGPAGTRYER